MSVDLVNVKNKCEKLEAKLSQAQDDLTTQKNLKNDIEETLTDKVNSLEEQLNEVSLYTYMSKNIILYIEKINILLKRAFFLAEH